MSFEMLLGPVALLVSNESMINNIQTEILFQMGSLDNQ